LKPYQSAGRVANASLRWFGACVLVAIAAAPPRAQIASASDLRVSVTVARSCTVSTGIATPEASAPDSLVSVKCAEGATPATPRVTVVDQPAPREEQSVVDAGATQPTDKNITVVVVNF
jgi:hypothetical protein